MNFLSLLACFDREIDRKCIDKISKKMENDKIHHTILRPEKIINHIHLRQALNMCLRNRRIGLKIAKRPEIDLICYICCTDNIKNAIDECVNDLGRCVLIVSFTENEREPLDEIMRSQRRLIEMMREECNTGDVDLAYCVSCYRKVGPSKYCETTDTLDVLEKIVELVLDRVE